MTPRDIVVRLNAGFVRVLKSPDIRSRLSGAGYDPVGDTPQEFTGYVKSEYTRWGEVVKKSGITAD